MKINGTFSKINNISLTLIGLCTEQIRHPLKASPYNLMGLLDTAIAIFSNVYLTMSFKHTKNIRIFFDRYLVAIYNQDQLPFILVGTDHDFR